MTEAIANKIIYKIGFIHAHDCNITYRFLICANQQRYLICINIFLT